MESAKAGITPEQKAQFRSQLESKGSELSGLLQAKVPPEIQQAAGTVVDDLQAIQQGGYVSSESLQGIQSSVSAAVADRTVSETEQATIKASIQAAGDEVPMELKIQLWKDVQTLGDTLEPYVPESAGP